MEALVLDKQFRGVGIVDVFESFIWTDRYSSWGDFEVYSHPTPELMDLMQYDYYLWNEQSEHTMIIEASKIETDIENGDHVTFTGRSLESILDRRIVWEFTELGHYASEDDEDEREYEEDFQRAIGKLLYTNCIRHDGSPYIPEEYSDEWVCPVERAIPNLFYQYSNDERFDGMTIKAQIPAGSNLYEVIKSLCDEKGVGFKIVLNSSNQFIFSLYIGQDRSYDQSTNPYVIFSPEYDNLLNSNYQESYADYRNAALVIGDDDGDDQRQATVISENVTGLDRREIFVDGSSMSWEDEEGNYYEPEEYDEQLAQLGREVLAEAGMVQSFDGEAEYRRTYEYQKDFFIGDIVQLENEYGIQATSRITEMVFSHDGSGENAIPTFVSLADNSLTTTYSSDSTYRPTAGTRTQSFLWSIPLDVHLNSVTGIDSTNSTISAYSMANAVLVTLHLETTQSFSSWTTICTDLPAPSASWYDTATNFASSFKRDMRIRVMSNNDHGELAIRYGTSSEGSDDAYRISFVYPINEGQRGSGGGGGGSTGDYNDLSNKPRINSVTLSGNKTLEELGLTIDSSMSSSSTNPVQNRVVKAYIDSHSGGGGGPYHISYEESNAVGSAVTGVATTGTPNYVPSGDIDYVAEDANVVASLVYGYDDYVLSFDMSTNFNHKIITQINGFKGSGVTFKIEEDQ